jgi:hypothetical protein
VKSLDHVITNYYASMQALGEPDEGQLNPTELQAKNERLIADLREISDINGKIAWIIVLGLVVLFFACIWLVLFKGDLPYAKAAQGLLGISAAGSLWRLHSLWSEKSATELLLRLAVDMKGDALKQIIDVLAKRALARIPKSSK